MFGCALATQPCCYQCPNLAADRRGSLRLMWRDYLQLGISASFLLRLSRPLRRSRTLERGIAPGGARMRRLRAMHGRMQLPKTLPHFLRCVFRCVFVQLVLCWLSFLLGVTLRSTLSLLRVQTALSVILEAGNPGNSVVGLIQVSAPLLFTPKKGSSVNAMAVLQVAAPSMPIDSLLPPGANTSGCPPWSTPSSTAGVSAVQSGALYNGMIAPFAAQTYRALVFSQVCIE